MNCKGLNELFAAYLDGEVTSEEQEQIQAHLSACQYCREELEALATTQNSLRQALKVTAAGATPSLQAWAGLQQRLEAEEQPRVTILGLAKSKMKEEIDTMIRGLVSRRLVWKTAVASILALALIVGLSLTIPSLTRQSPEALAASIVRNSPEVQAALDGEEIVEVEVQVITKVVDDEGNVLLAWVRTETRVVSVEVDLDTKKVTEVIRVHVPEFTAADEQKSIDIARADPRIQELLAQGAVISKVLPGYYFIFPDTLEVQGNVLIKLGDKEWEALIDLDEGKVFALMAPPTGFRAFMNNLVYRTAAQGMIIAIGILILIGLAIKNRLAVAVAGIASIVFGIAGLFVGLYSIPSAAWPLVLALGIPIVGLVIGIAKIRQRATRKWIAITGVVICSLALALYLASIVASILASHRSAVLFGL